MAVVSKALAGYGVGAFIGDAVNVYFTGKEYTSARQQGDNGAVALGKAAGSFLSGEIFYSSMNKYVGAKAGAGMGKVFGGVAKAFGGTGKIATGIGSTVGTMGTMVGFAMAQAGVQMIGAAQQNTAQKMTKGYSSKGKFGSGHFDMTEAGYTMRQRSLNAIRSNGLNTQSALGNEARTYYRGVV